MDEPTTEAGKRLLSFLDDPENAQSPLEPQWVDAIEAEARAAVLRELREEVAEMFSIRSVQEVRFDDLMVSRTAVLAAIDRRLADG
jgi:hypothetical protein